MSKTCKNRLQPIFVDFEIPINFDFPDLSPSSQRVPLQLIWLVRAQTKILEKHRNVPLYSPSRNHFTVTTIVWPSSSFRGELGGLEPWYRRRRRCSHQPSYSSPQLRRDSDFFRLYNNVVNKTPIRSVQVSVLGVDPRTYIPTNLRGVRKKTPRSFYTNNPPISPWLE